MDSAGGRVCPLTDRETIAATEGDLTLTDEVNNKYYMYLLRFR